MYVFMYVCMYTLMNGAPIGYWFDLGYVCMHVCVLHVFKCKSTDVCMYVYPIFMYVHVRCMYLE